MAKGQEESDDPVVPEDRRKAVPTAQFARGGKEVTASKVTGQLGLFRETAGSPKGAGDGRDAGGPASGRQLVPKSRTTKRKVPPAMTMEEVAQENNLRRAFKQVASNKGAPGPDKQSVDAVREHLGDVLLLLREALLDGSYRPGMIRRVWIPKAGGGQRGLGIPNVVDRVGRVFVVSAVDAAPAQRL